jgi:GT2 family glycosyltransferase
MHLNILPDPVACSNVSGGVNSVVADHAIGFLNAGHDINKNKAGLNIVHAIGQSADIDVFHCHGLYPIGPGYFDHGQYSKLNNIVLHNALKAKLTVCISEFSANILRHKLHIDPFVTRNGIWLKDYKRAGSQTGPILFPKTTLDANAKAGDMLYLKQNSKFNLLSIAEIPGIKSTGNLQRKKFLQTLANCSIYLGTTKENNSMATMEAMITGVPIVGYDYGFNREWLINGNGCELVAPGDQVGLVEAISKVMANWPAYSRKAREYAQIFDWQPVIDELLTLYHNLENRPENRKVSIIIPNHNYSQWVGEAIESALAQTVQCEVIVIDDKSTDDSMEIIQRYRRSITIIQNEVNLGVAETRNKAIAQASGEFIICLDADDKLRPNFVEKHLAVLNDRDEAIAYAPIDLIDADGSFRNQRLFRAAALPGLQGQGKNQIPSCCMFRKSFWARVGGYEQRYSPAEDAQLWLKIFAFGGVPRRAANESLMDYRVHTNSLSSRGFPNWWSDFNLNYLSPIQERDTKITIVLDKEEGSKETLWSLEKQDYPNWACSLQAQHKLAPAFPWLNKSTNRQGTVLTIKSGSVLPPNFLSEYVNQTPDWIKSVRRPESQLLSQPI